MVECQLHVEAHIVFNGSNVKIRVKDLYVRILLDVARCDIARAGCVYNDSLRSVRMQLGCDALYIQNYLGNVFLDTGNGSHFVEYAVDFDGCYGNTGQ